MKKEEHNLCHKDEMVDAPDAGNNPNGAEMYDLFMGKVEEASHTEEQCCTSGVHDSKSEKEEHARKTSSSSSSSAAAEVGALTI